MSRCFPFPPPGYEKKIKLDDANLIVKEKHKEKKHKKDKDKKERSERKEKEKSEKKKDDKDRKEKKHRDKKHKKRDKHKSSDEKKNALSLENENAEKLVSDGKPNSQIQDTEILAKLGKRLRNDDAAVDNHLLQQFTPIDQGKSKLLEKVEPHNDSKVAHSYEHIREKRDLGKMASTQYVDAREMENGFVAKFSGQVHREIQNKPEDVTRQADMFYKKNEEKEKINQRNNDDKASEHRKQEQRDDSRKSNKEKKEKMDSIKESIKKEGNYGKSLNFRGPSHGLMESLEHQGNLPNHKEPDSNGFLHDNGIRPNNMSRAVLLSRQGTQNGSNSHPISTNIATGQAAQTSNHKINGKIYPCKPVDTKVISPEPGPRANNFTADCGRPITSNHMVSNGFVTSPFVGIGKKAELCLTSPKVEQRAINSHTVEEKNFHSRKPGTENERNITWSGQDNQAKIWEKDLRRNGIKEAAELHISSKPSPSSMKAKEKSEKSKKEKSEKKDKSDKSLNKPPHPDLKYLDQILTVPHVDWPILDDQEWLFGTSDSPAKKQKLAVSDQTEPTREVWAEAMRLDSADVIALPYVIPY